jgi:hypothetical protein
MSEKETPKEVLEQLVRPLPELTPEELRRIRPYAAAAGERAGRRQARPLLDDQEHVPEFGPDAYLREVVEPAVALGLADTAIYLTWADGLTRGTTSLDPRVLSFREAALAGLAVIAEAIRLKRAVLAWMVGDVAPSVRPIALGPAGQVVFEHGSTLFVPFAPGEDRRVARSYVRSRLGRFRDKSDLIVMYSHLPEQAAALAEHLRSGASEERAAELLAAILSDLDRFADAVLRETQDLAGVLTWELAADGAVYTGDAGSTVVRVLDVNPEALKDYIER